MAHRDRVSRPQPARAALKRAHERAQAFHMRGAVLGVQRVAARARQAETPSQVPKILAEGADPAGIHPGRARSGGGSLML